jgi:hypothetical protein
MEEEPGTSFHLYALGSAYSDADASAERTTDPDAIFYVKLSDMRAVFQFQRGSGTGTGTGDQVFDASSDIRYYVFRKSWPTALNLNPSHAMLDRNESTGMLTPGASATAFSADKSLVKHDFIRYIALHLFNTIHGVDLFHNEEDLRENIVYYGEVARVGIMSVLDTVGTMSANITMAVDGSGNRYSTNEDMTVTNISRELMRQIAVSAPGRLGAIDEAGGGGAGIQSIPLSENDTFNFKVVMETSPGQNALTNVAAIPARTYNIKLIMKSSVESAGGGGGAYTNTAASDCVSFPNGYPYAVNVYDISASNASVASSVYADGSPPVPIPLLRYGYQGWYYTNSDAWVNPAPSVRNKINWYLLPNSATTTVGDLRYIRLNLHVFSRVSTPFLTVYTTATGTGDAGGWYKSKRVYVVANAAAAALSNNTNYCFYMNWNGYSVAPFTVAHNNVALSLTTVSSGAVGAFGSGEVLFAYSIGTDSGSARGNVEFILSSVVVGEAGAVTEKEYGYIPV